MHITPALSLFATRDYPFLPEAGIVHPFGGAADGERPEALYVAGKSQRESKIIF